MVGISMAKEGWSRDWYNGRGGTKPPIWLRNNVKSGKIDFN